MGESSSSVGVLEASLGPALRCSPIILGKIQATTAAVREGLLRSPAGGSHSEKEGAAKARIKLRFSWTRTRGGRDRPERLSMLAVDRSRLHAGCLWSEELGCPAHSGAPAPPLGPIGQASKDALLSFSSPRLGLVRTPGERRRVVSAHEPAAPGVAWPGDTVRVLLGS